MEMPPHLRDHLVHNIIPVGGIGLTNTFFYRFSQEVVHIIQNNQHIKKRFSGNIA